MLVLPPTEGLAGYSIVLYRLRADKDVGDLPTVLSPDSQSCFTRVIV